MSASPSMPPIGESGLTATEVKALKDGGQANAVKS